VWIIRDNKRADASQVHKFSVKTTSYTFLEARENRDETNGRMPQELKMPRNQSVVRRTRHRIDFRVGNCKGGINDNNNIANLPVGNSLLSRLVQAAVQRSPGSTYARHPSMVSKQESFPSFMLYNIERGVGKFVLLYRLYSLYCGFFMR
jgi:hypothetical protein